MYLVDKICCNHVGKALLLESCLYRTRLLSYLQYFCAYLGEWGPLYEIFLVSGIALEIEYYRTNALSPCRPIYSGYALMMFWSDDLHNIIRWAVSWLPLRVHNVFDTLYAFNSQMFVPPFNTSLCVSMAPNGRPNPIATAFFSFLFSSPTYMPLLLQVQSSWGLFATLPSDLFSFFFSH